MVELQDLLEKQNYELAQMKERMSSLSSRVSEVEQELETARKDLIKSEEMNNKYQRDIKEVTAHTAGRQTSKAALLLLPLCTRTSQYLVLLLHVVHRVNKSHSNKHNCTEAQKQHLPVAVL